jgi:plastocyanin
MRTPLRSITIGATALATVLSFGLTGCGSSSKTAATPTTSAATTASTTATTAAASGNAVTIQNFSFNPGNESVKVGTKVTWTNQDSFNHTVKTIKGPAKPDSTPIQPGKSFSYVFTKPGTYQYICGIHNNMHGTVVVTQ